MNRITGLMPSLIPVFVLSSLLWAQVTMGQTAVATHTPDGPIDTPDADRDPNTDAYRPLFLSRGDQSR